jgi:hypothetical protein
MSSPNYDGMGLVVMAVLTVVFVMGVALGGCLNR